MELAGSPEARPSALLQPPAPTKLERETLAAVSHNTL